MYLPGNATMCLQYPSTPSSSYSTNSSYNNPFGYGPSIFIEARDQLPVISVIPSPVDPRTASSRVYQANHIQPPVQENTYQRQRWSLFRQRFQSPFGSEEVDHNGRSVLEEWVRHLGGQVYQCNVPLDDGSICSKQHNRLDRTVAHIRKHLDFRPFVCAGRCGNLECTLTFGTNANLKQHVEKEVRVCRYCTKTVLRQNFGRHEKKCSNNPGPGALGFPQKHRARHMPY